MKEPVSPRSSEKALMRGMEYVQNPTDYTGDCRVDSLTGFIIENSDNEARNRTHDPRIDSLTGLPIADSQLRQDADSQAVKTLPLGYDSLTGYGPGERTYV